MNKYIGAIFDLDGVLVDTAIFHYMAWEKIAQELKIPFTKHDNERLKGVSRMESLDILLSLAVPGTSGCRKYSEKECRLLSERKNKLYVDMIRQSQNLLLLPGSLDTLRGLRQLDIRIALGSSSKNAPLILERLGIADYFDAVVDGRHVARTKPDPEVFLLAAGQLSAPPEMCIVFEDSAAGIKAAVSAGMYAVGIGSPGNLPGADLVMPELKPDQILELFGRS